MQLGVAGSAEYDNNIYRTDSAKEDDFVFRITPRVTLIEDEGKFHWDLRYQMPWEKAIEADRVDGLRHFVRAKASRHVGERTQVFFSDTFSYSEAVSSVAVLDDAGATSVGTFREPVIRNAATLGVQYGFTPRLSGALAFSHRLFESDIPLRSDNMVYGGNANLNYALSSRHQLGGGAAVTYQDLDASNDGRVSPSQGFFLNLYGAWTWTIDETTSFQLTAGPTFVKNKQDAPPFELTGQPTIPYQPYTGFVYNFNSCDVVNGFPVLLGCAVDITTVLDEGDRTTTSLSFLDGTNIGGSSSSWTYFGEVALNKRWSPQLVSTLMFQRTESTGSGTSSATLNLVSLLTTWRISELWDAGLRADFTQRKSTGPTRETLVVVGEIPTGLYAGAAQSIGLTSRESDRFLDTNRWGVAARMSRLITKHTRASLRYSYNEQTSKSNTAGSSSDFSNHLVTLGVEYEFDRWDLW